MTRNGRGGPTCTSSAAARGVEIDDRL